MLIVCPSCTTSYDVDSASLPPNGRQVRCARCRTVWHAKLSHADKLVLAAAALAADLAEHVVGDPPLWAGPGAEAGSSERQGPAVA